MRVLSYQVLPCPTQICSGHFAGLVWHISSFPNLPLTVQNTTGFPHVPSLPPKNHQPKLQLSRTTHLPKNLPGPLPSRSHSQVCELFTPGQMQGELVQAARYTCCQDPQQIIRELLHVSQIEIPRQTELIRGGGFARCDLPSKTMCFPFGKNYAELLGTC